MMLSVRLCRTEFSPSSVQQRMGTDEDEGPDKRKFAEISKFQRSSA